MAKAQRILIVEDDEDIQELLSYNLELEGYKVDKVASGDKALQRVQADPPNMILLDLMLPGIGGLDVCRRLKEDVRTRNIPVVMVTAKGEEADVVTGLELGADDYVSKPFRPRELVARVKAVLRRGSRAAADNQAVVEIGGLRIDPGRREVQVKGKRVDLTFTEFEVLRFLAQRPGWVFTRYQIVDAVRGENYPVTDRSVDVQIVGLRKKLGRAASCIETVRGIGYRFRDSE